jgi:hypothetical protein
MLHYHGTPITPRAKLLELAGRNFCVSFAEPRDLEVCHEIGQSVMLDNGAYSFWKAGAGDVDLTAYANWAYPWLAHRTTWCVIPDKIDGTEADNDRLLREWEVLTSDSRILLEQCAPVWHMHESIRRLRELAVLYPRICLGSSGDYAKIGDERWHRRMCEAMDALCGDGPAPCWLHMLRGLSLAGSDYPFASADSTSIAQNHAGNNTRRTAPKDPRRMADDLDGRQCAPRWRHIPGQLTIDEVLAMSDA